MSAEWNTRFSFWAQAPSQTETEKIERSIRAVRNAMAADGKLSALTKVFVQGSYRNRVNVRQDSDVDIGVLYTGDIFGVRYPEGLSDADVGVVNSTYKYSDFKNEVETALVNYFGRAAVTRGKKAFDLHENSYRLDADVVPMFVHRRYAADGSYICGVQLLTDDFDLIINWPIRLYESSEWPNQHYENGKQKNESTGRAYRGVVRIVKKLRILMDEAGFEAAKSVKGFQVECLIWNAPNDCFLHNTWYEDVKAVLRHLSVNLATLTLCRDWGEVSEFKYLIRDQEDVRRRYELFVDTARAYIGAI
ncbi:MAG: nucleotidyltransferase [Rudaea sp.]|nr:nucleotidyltransferase [Rudaea sp.]